MYDPRTQDPNGAMLESIETMHQEPERRITISSDEKAFKSMMRTGFIEARNYAIEPFRIFKQEYVGDELVRYCESVTDADMRRLVPYLKDDDVAQSAYRFWWMMTRDRKRPIRIAKLLSNQYLPHDC